MSEGARRPWVGSQLQRSAALASLVDELVAEGVVESRSDAVRQGLRVLIDQHQRRRTAEAIIRGYEQHPQVASEIGWSDEAKDKRCPVLIVTRTEAIPALTWILVASLTRTIRGIPTEVNLDPGDGLPAPCVAAFDNLQPIRR